MNLIIVSVCMLLLITTIIFGFGISNWDQ